MFISPVLPILSMMFTQNPREAAYLALLAAQRDEAYIADTLETWRLTAKPSARDFHLAQRIASGTCQMTLALDFLAASLASQKKLRLKNKEKMLLRLSLYQIAFLERIPHYAIADEMVSLANKFCHFSFKGFLNALLRQACQHLPPLPQEESIESLSIRNSYPAFFVQQLLDQEGLGSTKEILALGNEPSPIMVRLRHSAKNLDALQLLTETPCPMAQLTDLQRLSKIAASSEYYIQNATPAALISQMSSGFTMPKTILDLCASPGGKLVHLHDCYPQARLFGNDLSEQKLLRLQENCEKYGIPAQLSCGAGEQFRSSEKFDLILLDVPCSNSGVLNKRPEARWRLSQENLDRLKRTQKALVNNAVQLLAPLGQIWFMTCSILSAENEELIAEVCQELSLRVLASKRILPNRAGWDGGFACSLTR